MESLVERLGAKEPGELILAGSGGWNELVGEIARMNAELRTELGTLGAGLRTLTDEVKNVAVRVAEAEQANAKLRADLDAFEHRIEPLNYRVTLKTGKVMHAIGELAEITAQVRDLRGRPVSDRPWIDFLASWGQFMAAPGFETSSRWGAGNRTISVQTDEAGLARVRIGAESVEALSDDAQREVATFLQTKLGDDRSIAERVVSATTSVEAADAFAKVTEHYDRAETPLRVFADDYYAGNAPRARRPLFIPDPEFRWRDFRATVLVVAKSDTDPTTADESRGAASIQLVFRDWIMPWLRMHYFGQSQRNALLAQVKLDATSVANVEEVKRQVDVITPPNAGLLGRLRSFEVVNDALANVATTSPTVVTKVEAAREAVAIKRAVEAPQLGPVALRRFAP